MFPSLVYYELKKKKKKHFGVKCCFPLAVVPGRASFLSAFLQRKGEGQGWCRHRDWPAPGRTGRSHPSSCRESFDHFFLLPFTGSLLVCEGWCPRCCQWSLSAGVAAPGRGWCREW